MITILITAVKFRPSRPRVQSRTHPVGASMSRIRFGFALAALLCAPAWPQTAAPERSSLPSRELPPTAPHNAERYASLQKILSTPVSAGTNLAVVSHGNPFYSVAGPPYLAEGEAAMIRPMRGDFQIVGRIRVESWNELKGTAGRN